jgi:peroxiredoxin
MAVRPRLLAGSLAVAVLVLAGVAVAAAVDGDTAAEPDVVLDRNASAVEPGIRPNAEVAGDPFPDVELTDNDGNTVSTADLLGQPLVVNVWNSTCAPCEKELPDFAAVHAELGDRIRFVGVNNLDTPARNESFARERGVQYELLRDVDGALISEIGIARLPFTLFVTADGTIIRQAGVLDAEQLRAHTTELLTTSEEAG